MCARSCGHVHISTGHTQLSHNSGDKLQRGHLISRCLCRSRGFTTKPPRLHCSKGALRQLVLPLASVPDAVSATSQSAAEDQQQQDVTWAAATMVQNRNVSADGSMRTLTLSIEDPAYFLEGRKISRRQDGTRWIDTYKLLEPTAGIMNCTGEEHQPISHAFFLPLLAFAVESMVLCQDAVNGLQLPEQMVGIRALHRAGAAVKPASHLVCLPEPHPSVPAWRTKDAMYSLQHVLQLPGQMVGIKYCTGNEQQPSQQASRLFAIASSPYESRRESALLDASLIEVLVDRKGGADEAALAEKGPGAQLSVSQIEGRGYASLFNSYVGLLSAAEESRPLLMLGMGARGMGPLRAALEWTPIQAHATANAVSLFYVTESQQSAAYLADWDSWRQAGATVNPVYIPSLKQQASESTLVQDELENAVFGGEEGLAGALGGDPRECAILMSGLPGSVVAAITRRLTLEGVTRERILFCDFM